MVTFIVVQLLLYIIVPRNLGISLSRDCIILFHNPQNVPQSQDCVTNREIAKGVYAVSMFLRCACTNVCHMSSLK